jgi:hypothetical protein
MAKSGINIGADATLVAAAGRLATANQPFDMTGSMDRVLDARSELLGDIEKNFKENIKLIDGANGALKDTIEVLNEKLNNGDLSQEARRELQAEIEGYRAQMKDIPWGKKGKKQREDLEYEINRKIKTTKNQDEAFADVLGTINSDLYDPSQLDHNYINFMQQIAASGAGEETDPGFTKTKNDKGNTVYSYAYLDDNGEEQKIEGTIFDIQKKLNGTKKDYEFIKEQNEVLFGWQQWAKDNPNAKFEDIYSRIATGMETSFAGNPEKFQSVINHSMGWSDKSYAETLRDPQSEEFQNIIQILSDINDSDFDFDGSGTVDAADFQGDFVTEENINTMIKALTDPSVTQRRTAHKAAAKFYADTEARKAFDFGKRDRPKTGGGGEGSGSGTTKYGGFGAYQFNTGGGSFSGEDRAPKSQTWRDAQTKRTALDALQDVRGTHATYVWNEEARMYEVGEDQFTRGQVAAIEGVMKEGESENSAAFAVLSGDTKDAVKEEARDSGQITSSELTSASGDTAPATAASNLNAFYGLENKPIQFERAGWGERNGIGFGMGNMIAFAGPDGKRYQLGELLTDDKIQEFYELFPYPTGAGAFSKNAPIHTQPNYQTGGENTFSNVWTGDFYINTSADYRDDATKAINWLMENSSLLNPYMKDVTTVESVESNSGAYD